MVVVIAAALLARTVRAAQKINTKAQNIAKNGTGINTSTDSIIQLKRTNTLARSILSSATPLQGQLSGIVTTAQDINGLAGSINSTAGSINSTAGSINTTAGAINSTAGAINSTAGTINTQAGAINTAAGSINTSANSINSSAGAINSSAGAIDSTAGAINRSAGSINKSVTSIRTSARRVNSDARSILPTARLIDTDVRLINQNLDVTLSLVTAVKADTASILGQAVAAHDTAACIDQKIGRDAADGDCQGRGVPTRSGGGNLELRSTMPDSEEDSKDTSKRSQAPELDLPAYPQGSVPNPKGSVPKRKGSLPKRKGSKAAHDPLDKLPGFSGGTK
ncbi:MAG: hypothetical protein ACR2ML_06505 [Solirubrobacteraceae bacterium]